MSIIQVFHRNPQRDKSCFPEMNNREPAKLSYPPFFIALFITFQSGSLSSATLWISIMPSHAAALRPRAQIKSKLPPVASAGSRSGQNPTLCSHLTPAKPPPPRPKGPAQHRFTRDVVTRNKVAFSSVAGKNE